MNGINSPAQSWVFRIIIINVVVFVLQIFTISEQVVFSVSGLGQQISIPVLTFYLGLTPVLVVKKLFLWQVFTYMFLHSPYDLVHIFFNMYAVLIFGMPVESAWGGRRFLFYYLFCGVGAGISIFVINLISHDVGFIMPTIGASGAVFGLLLAFGVLYPNSEILLFFILPIKAKYLVVLYGLTELYFELFGGQSNISHIGHLGGLLFGLIYFYLFRKGFLRFKSKIISAGIQKKTGEYAKAITRGRIKQESGDNEIRIRILEKLKNAGYDSLTDDEVQYIKYLSIMGDENEFICDKMEFKIKDPYCMECKDNGTCFLREVKKYIKE